MTPVVPRQYSKEERPMAVGRFIAMVQMLVWCRTDGKYLLLRRSPTKDFAPGEWESGTDRLEQGEGFGQALRRESREELGLEVRVECLLGTATSTVARPSRKTNWSDWCLAARSTTRRTFA